MNKHDLIEAISADTRTSKDATERVLDSLFRRIKDSIANGERVKLYGFGTFELTRTAARVGRNPRTGETVLIDPIERPRFTPSLSFKGRVKKR